MKPATRERLKTVGAAVLFALLVALALYLTTPPL